MKYWILIYLVAFFYPTGPFFQVYLGSAQCVTLQKDLDDFLWLPIELTQTREVYHFKMGFRDEVNELAKDYLDLAFISLECKTIPKLHLEFVGYL